MAWFCTFHRLSSEACLGEVKDKGNEFVCLYLNINGKKLVLGTLSSKKFPQQQLDLVFPKDFELSHNGKNGSVYFSGYKTNNAFDSPQAKQQKPHAPERANAVKFDSAAAKQKVKNVEPIKDVKPEEDEDSEGFENDLSDSIEDGEIDTDEDDDDENDEEEEDTPKKVKLGKERPAEYGNKTPGCDKKAKLATPQETDGKKGGGHVATPHPSKQARKTPANQSKQQTPKSAGTHPCKSCGRL